MFIILFFFSFLSGAEIDLPDISSFVLSLSFFISCVVLDMDKVLGAGNGSFSSSRARISFSCMELLTKYRKASSKTRKIGNVVASFILLYKTELILC